MGWEGSGFSLFPTQSTHPPISPFSSSESYYSVGSACSSLRKIPVDIKELTENMSKLWDLNVSPSVSLVSDNGCESEVVCAGKSEEEVSSGYTVRVTRKRGRPKSLNWRPNGLLLSSMCGMSRATGSDLDKRKTFDLNASPSVSEDGAHGLEVMENEKRIKKRKKSKNYYGFFACKFGLSDSDEEMLSSEEAEDSVAEDSVEEKKMSNCAACYDGFVAGQNKPCGGQ